MGGNEQYLSGLGQMQVTDFCKGCNELSGFLQCLGILEQLATCKFVKKNSAPQTGRYIINFM